ncbi:MAG: DUF3817 domain-containing protein [Sulfurospirillum sp.]|jgi:integral membrane protein|nr:DUF3817 domain-containing protein [Sulfurospirillum sp.]
MVSTPIGRLRMISIIEGLSFLGLLGIAMPMKYLMGDPTLVRYFGMAHGLLFIFFIASLFESSQRYTWSMKFSLFCFACSLVPFAPFWLELKLKQQAKMIAKQG